MPEATDIVLLYVTTTDTAEAEMIAEAIVGERLAACANIIPGMRSLYHWQGKLEKGTESVLILKTRTALAGKVTQRIRELHSYSVPCVLQLAIQSGNPDYLGWLMTETSNRKS